MKSFDTNWRFARGSFSCDEDTWGWERVSLPHDFAITMLLDQNEQTYAFPGTTEEDWKSNNLNGFFPGGIGCYAKEFSLSQTDLGKEIFLCFEGIYRNSDLYLNGHQVHHQSNGYMGFEVDITPYAREENLLFIRVDNSRQKTSRWYTGSGIYRHAFLDVRPRGCAGVPRITIPQVSTEQASVQVEVSGGILARLLNPAGELLETTPLTAGKNVLSFLVSEPKLWSVDNPALYTLVLVSPEGYERQQSFGIRKIEFNARDGFLLNDQPLFLHGFNIHHDLGVCGAAAFDSLLEDRMRLLKALGCNALRLSHNPHAPEVLDWCDRLGILVFDECFDKLGDQYVEDFQNTWKNELKAFVDRDFNHPSVVIWSVGNETDQQRFDGDDGAAFIRQMVDYVHTLDSTRPATIAQYPCRKDGIKWTDPGWQKSEPSDVAFVTDLNSQNYTWEFFERDKKKHPEFIYVQSEAAVGVDGLCGWEALRQQKTVGQFYWGGIDYLGESMGLLFKGWWRGFVDICGQKRPICYQAEAAFCPEKPVCHIGVSGGVSSTVWNDVDLKWKFLYDHWNWKHGQILRIMIYSNASAVELVLNGTSLGMAKKCDCFAFCMEVVFQPGSLLAIARDAEGHEVARHVLVTAGEPAKLMLKANRRRLPADGTDAVAVDAFLVDDQGIVCKTAEQEIGFTVTGGLLAGCGTGNLADSVSFGEPIHLAYEGRVQVVLRGNGEPGEICLRAASGNLQADIQIPKDE